jgi:hypothetical protein
VEINQKKTVQVQAKTLKVHLKVSDRFSASIHDQDGVELGGQEDGYVPGFMPGQHYGDYVILDIDLDSGQITNWKTPSAKDIEAFIGDEDEE